VEPCKNRNEANCGHADAVGEYVLITPAYNEQENLPRLFESVHGQELRPIIWIIVNDGSTDQTARVIDEASRKYGYVKALHLERDYVESYYARKIHAFQKGVAFLNALGVEYEYIANLDADMTLPSDFYSRLLHEFEIDPQLGIAGGVYRYADDCDRPLLDDGYVSAGTAMFRRKCFQQVGGFRPLKYGAEDTLACLMARAKGWNTRRVSACMAVTHRRVGTSGGTGMLKARFRQGISEYNIGYHPLFAFLKLIKRMVVEKPYLVGACARYIGCLCGPFFVDRQMVPAEAVAQFRKEQFARLKALR